jgi:hypothetical protein
MKDLYPLFYLMGKLGDIRSLYRNEPAGQLTLVLFLLHFLLVLGMLTRLWLGETNANSAP